MKELIGMSVIQKQTKKKKGIKLVKLKGSVDKNCILNEGVYTFV